MHTLDEVVMRGETGATAIAVPGGARITYQNLRDQVEACADALASAGIRRGDRIALVLPNGIETIVMFIAAATAGVASPLNPAYKESEFRFYLEDTGAKALVVPRGGGEAARKALPDGVVLLEASVDEAGQVALEGGSMTFARAAGPHDEDEALVLHTSGTTSRPKLVPLRQRNLAFSAENIARFYRLTPDDVAMCVMPLFHIHGLMASTMATLSSGGLVVVPPKFDR